MRLPASQPAETVSGPADGLDCTCKVSISVLRQLNAYGFLDNLQAALQASTRESEIVLLDEPVPSHVCKLDRL